MLIFLEVMKIQKENNTKYAEKRKGERIIGHVKNEEQKPTCLLISH